MLPLVPKSLYMKKIIYVCGMVAVFTILSTSLSAQIRKIPAEVTNAFEEKYPNATNVEWRDKLSGFTASFRLDSVDYIASFNNRGTWEHTEEAIEEDDLPDVVKDGFDKSRYSDWNVGHVSRFDMADNEVRYKIEVTKGDIKKRNLYFNSNGKLLKDKLTL
jgi:hypothetical protein